MNSFFDELGVYLPDHIINEIRVIRAVIDLNDTIKTRTKKLEFLGFKIIEKNFSCGGLKEITVGSVFVYVQITQGDYPLVVVLNKKRNQK